MMYKKFIFLPNDGVLPDKIEIFNFPTPSNNTSKLQLSLFLHNQRLYQIQDYSFSKSCKYKEIENLASEKYHYNDNGEPIKSAFLINEADRSDGEIISSSVFQISTLYDLAFNLISVFYKESISNTEEEYVTRSFPDFKKLSKKMDNRFLTVRDMHDFLVDTHDTNWNLIPMILLEDALNRVAQCTEEGGDRYYKLTEETITAFLLDKVEKIVDNFPKSLPLSLEYPEDIQNCLKYIMACNLLISLIPFDAYKILLKSPKIEGFVQKYNEFKKNSIQASIDRAALTESAINVGIQKSSDIIKKKPVKVVKKNTLVNKKKVSVGKGAIDGFFKLQKKVDSQRVDKHLKNEEGKGEEEEDKL